MALFPQNPANNQQMTVNGITYVYNSSLTAWVRFATFLGNVTANNGTFYDNVSVTNNITSAGNISASGNITGNFFLGNGSQLTGIISTTAQTVTNAAQPNITSVGTLSILSVSGNANVGNIGATNGVFTNVSGNGASLSSITGANVTGQVANALVAGTVYTNSQPNITSVGTLTSLSVSGNANVGNLGTGIITATGTITGGNLSTSGNISAGGTLSVTGNANAGNIGATNGVFTNVSGNGAALNNLPASNIVGQVANALVAGTVYTNVQPNITSVGTLTGLSVSGNANVGNLGTAGLISAAGNITGNFILGNGAFLTGVITSVSNITNGTSNVTIATSGGNVTTSVGGNANIFVVTGTGANVNGTFSVSGNANLGNVGATNGVFTNVSGNGAALTSITGANVTGQVANALVSGTVYTNAQPNITSVGTLSSLSVNGNVTAGNLSGTLLTGTLTTAAQPNITSVGTLTSLSVSGNANIGNIGATNGVFTNVSGNGAALTSITGANVTGTVANATFATTAGSATTAGTVTTNAQPNITSVGTLSSLSVTGNANTGNIGATNGVFVANIIVSTGSGGTVSGANLVSANFFAGTLTTSAQPNITSVGTLASLSVSGNANIGNIGTTGLITATGNITGGNLSGTLVTGTLTTAAQPNITGVGTLTNLNVNGNAVVGGNLFVNGNLTYMNVETVAVEDPIIQLQTGANGAAPTSNSGKDVGTSLNYYDTAAKQAFVGWQNSTGKMLLASNVSITGEVVTVNGYGNTVLGGLEAASISATGNANVGNIGAINGVFTNVSGNGAALTSITGANVTGTVANATFATTASSATSATTAGTVTTAAQPNITSVGTLTSLSVSGNANLGNIGTAGLITATGNVTGGNLSTAGNVTAAFFIGNGSQLTGVTAGTSTTAQTVTTNAQPNITSVGTLTSLSVSGNANVGNIGAINGVFTNVSGNGAALTSITGANVTGTVANATFATTAGSATTAGAVTTNAQPNITSVGTLINLSVSNDANVGNLGTAGFVTATGNVQGGNLLTVGRVGIGTTSVTNSVLNVTSPISGSTTSSGISLSSQVQSGVTSAARYFQTSAATQAATFTLPTLTHYFAAQGIFGSDSAVTTQQGFFVDSSLIGAATNYGFRGQIPFGTNRFNLYMDGTADNHLAGNLGIGTTNPTSTLTVNGTLSASGNANVANISANNAIFVNISGNGAGLTSLPGANVIGIVANAAYAANAGHALTANTVTNNAQPNITSVGTLTSLSVSGNASFTGANVSLGNVGNVKITGGVNGFVLATDGTGNVNWVTNPTQVAGAFVHTQFTPSNTWVITHGLGVQYVNVQIVDDTGNSWTGRYNYPAITFNNTTALTVTFDSAQTGYAAITSGGGQQGPAGPSVAIGGSNTQIQFNDAGNLNGVSSFTFNKTSNLVTITGLLSVSGNANVGNVGATNGVFTNISGTLSTAAQTSITSLGVLSSLSVSGNANIGNIGTSGLITATGNITANNITALGDVTAQNVNSLSDASLKLNINPLSDAQTIINQLVGVEYDWKNGHGHSYGLLAQDVEKVLPDAVRINDSGLKTVNYQMIIPFLIETIKQLGAEVAELKNKKRKTK